MKITITQLHCIFSISKNRNPLELCLNELLNSKWLSIVEDGYVNICYSRSMNDENGPQVEHYFELPKDLELFLDELSDKDIYSIGDMSFDILRIWPEFLLIPGLS